MAYGTNEPGFVADLRSALDVWRVHPLLPIVTVVVTALGTLNTAGGSANPVLTVLSLQFGLFLLGFVGTTRVWYVRAWRGESGGVRLADRAGRGPGPELSALHSPGSSANNGLALAHRE